MPRIAVDAMGGDHAPLEVVRGALDAAQAGVDVVLVGDETQIGPIQDRFSSALPVVHAAVSTYQTALKSGYGEEDKGAMIKIFETLLDVKCR